MVFPQIVTFAAGTHMRLFRSTTPGELHLGLAILRVITGIIFMAHGAQKFFVFGVDGVAVGFTQMGIPLAGVAAPAVALVELLGGLALVAGLLTRVAALGLAVVMVVAMLVVHLSAGFFLPDGIEFTLMLLGAAVTLAITGAGAFSVDAFLMRRVAPVTAHARTDRIRRVA
jgi:putative oxidoreductase